MISDAPSAAASEAVNCWLLCLCVAFEGAQTSTAAKTIRMISRQASRDSRANPVSNFFDGAEVFTFGSIRVPARHDRVQLVIIIGIEHIGANGIQMLRKVQSQVNEIIIF